MSNPLRVLSLRGTRKAKLAPVRRRTSSWSMEQLFYIRSANAETSLWYFLPTAASNGSEQIVVDRPVGLLLCAFERRTA